MHNNQENDLKPHFGPFLALNGPFLGQQIFFQKSENNTFLDLFQANLMQKSEKTNGGKYENFCHGQTYRQTDVAGLLRTPASPNKNVGRQ